MNSIIVIGDLILDRYIYGKINRMSPEDSSIPVIDIESSEYKLGGAGNVATNLKSLIPKSFVDLASIYSDSAADRLINNKIGVFTTPISDFEENVELIKDRIINLEINKQIVRIDNKKHYSDKFIDHFIRHLERRLPTLCSEFYDCIVLSDYKKGTIDKKVISYIKYIEKPVFIDTKNPDLSLFSKLFCPIVKMNQKEYNTAVKTNEEAVLKLPFLFVTQGASGSSLYINKNKSSEKLGFNYSYMHHKCTVHIDNPDVCGAGDVYLAALVAKYLNLKNENKNIHISDCLDEMLKYATEAATASVKKSGTSTVTHEEVLQCQVS